MASPMPAHDGICHYCGDSAHLYNSNLAPGIYLERHALIADGDREVAIMDFVGTLNFGGVESRDPDAIDALAAWLTARAKRMREVHADPRYPDMVAPTRAGT